MHGGGGGGGKSGGGGSSGGGHSGVKKFFLFVLVAGEQPPAVGTMLWFRCVGAATGLGALLHTSVQPVIAAEQTSSVGSRLSVLPCAMLDQLCSHCPALLQASKGGAGRGVGRTSCC